jgi:hypothetical protein
MVTALGPCSTCRPPGPGQQAVQLRCLCRLHRHAAGQGVAEQQGASAPSTAQSLPTHALLQHGGLKWM